MERADAGQEEREQGDEEVEAEPLRQEGQADDEPEAEGKGEGVEQGELAGPLRRGAEPALQGVEGEAAQPPAQKGDRDGHEGEVIPDRGGEDPGEGDLEEQAGQGDEEDA